LAPFKHPSNRNFPEAEGSFNIERERTKEKGKDREEGINVECGLREVWFERKRERERKQKKTV